MSDEKGIKMILGDDGVFRESKDDYDITIHCKTKDEADIVMLMLNRSNQRIRCLIDILVAYMRAYVGSSNCPYKYKLIMADDIEKPDCPSSYCEDCKDEFFEKLTNKLIDNYVIK